MPDRLHHHVEISGDTATLHLAGFIGADCSATLVELCGRLPLTVDTLRVDLRAMGSLTAEALATVRGLLHHWRTTRQGEFRLNTSYLQATCQPVERRAERGAPACATPALHEHPWQVQHPEWVPSFASPRARRGVHSAHVPRTASAALTARTA